MAPTSITSVLSHTASETVPKRQPSLASPADSAVFPSSSDDEADALSASNHPAEPLADASSVGFVSTNEDDPLDDYEMVKFINQGGEGVVNVLRHKETRKLVVCKTGWRNCGVVDEVKILRKVCKHPRIVGMHAFFEPHGYLRKSNVILEYCQGGDLAAYRAGFSARGQQLLEALLWHFYAQLGEAMHFLHDTCDVIHRDLKSENVLVVPGATAASYPDLKIADFGMACTELQPVEESHVGTRIWWGPEPRPGTKQMDIWAVGAIIHWLALKTLPVDRSDIYVSSRAGKRAQTEADEKAPRVVRAISDIDTVKKYLEKREGVENPTPYSEGLDRWMKRSLDPDPTTRITAEELCKEFVPLAATVVASTFEKLDEEIVPPAPLDDWGSDNSPAGFGIW